MSNLKTELDELKQTSAAALTAFEKVKADIVVVEDREEYCSRSDMMAVMDSLQYTFRSINDRINYLSESFYNHLDGHLPKAPGPAAMKSAIKALKWDGDFDVQSKTVYAGLDEGFIKVGGKVIN